MKKAVSSILSCVLCIGLCGCSGIDRSVKQTNESLTVSYYGKDIGASMDIMREAEGKFRVRYPEIELTVDRIPFSANQDKGEAYYKQMAVEVMAGKGPDVFMVDSRFMDVYKMMRAGVFADLADYMNNDPDFDRKNYQQKVMEGGVYKGHQYTIPLGYTLPVLLTEKELLESIPIDFLDSHSFMDFWKQLGQYTQQYAKDSQLPRPLQGADRLRCFPNLMGNGWIDYENQTVNLDMPEMESAFQVYKDMYNMIEERPSDRNIALYGDLFGPNALLEKSILFEPYTGWREYTAMHFSAMAVGGFGDPVYLPIYDCNGTIQAQIISSIAVRGGSPNQENAWKFVKIMLEPDVITALPTIGRSRDTPITTEAFEFSLRDVEIGFDNNGLNMFGPTGRIDYYQPVPKELTAVYREAVSKIGGAYYPSETALDKLYEGFEPYLKGEKSYKACKEMAESNVMIYVSE